MNYSRGSVETSQRHPEREEKCCYRCEFVSYTGQRAEELDMKRSCEVCECHSPKEEVQEGSFFATDEAVNGFKTGYHPDVIQESREGDAPEYMRLRKVEIDGMQIALQDIGYDYMLEIIGNLQEELNK